ncbi:MAG: hypothetical protein IJD46_04080, partial [Bacilli bacterium]|nr:hypothetical protein [Bacilli bacterium]
TAGGNTEPTVSGAYESNMILYGTLAGSSEETEEDEVTYELRIWIDANAPISEQNKTFQSKISVTIGQGIINPYKEGTLAYDILSNYGGISAITEVTDFSSGTTASDAGLYKAQDDLGVSYYFRGAPTNNYVKFGTYSVDIMNPNYLDTPYGICPSGDCSIYIVDVFETMAQCEETRNINLSNGMPSDYVCGKILDEKAGDPMYWRIVRINGDGTIRLVYDGTSPVTNRTAHTATIGATAYNTNANDPKYVGYTYDVNGVETASTIKGVVDDWYEEHLKDTYEKYIADSIFCNDREIYKYQYLNEDWTVITDPNQATYINEYYSPYGRLADNKAPELTCTNKSDRYTTNDKLGNGLLSNPVGLLTADEVFFAGGTNLANNTYYLYSNENYWTFSPESFNDGYPQPFVWFVSGDGIVTNTGVTSVEINARPVINLKADVKFTGDGRIDTNTPYEIVMN